MFTLINYEISFGTRRPPDTEHEDMALDDKMLKITTPAIMATHNTADQLLIDDSEGQGLNSIPSDVQISR